MKTINVDMYQTLAVAVGVLYLGGFLKKKVRFLETFCIPSPVIGGVIFAIISCILHVAGIVEFQFDETLKTVCMVMFFTSVGFQANIKVLKAGGKSLIVFLLCLIVLIFAQNAVAVGLSKLLGVSSLVGMCTGSIPMVGGHGTSGAFGTVLEEPWSARSNKPLHSSGYFWIDYRLCNGRTYRQKAYTQTRSAENSYS